MRLASASHAQEFENNPNMALQHQPTDCIIVYYYYRLPV